MKIKWNIETGYVNRIPDWELEIDDEELEGMTEDEIMEYIDRVVYDVFTQTISCTWEAV